MLITVCDRCKEKAEGRAPGARLNIEQKGFVERRVDLCAACAADFWRGFIENLPFAEPPRWQGGRTGEAPLKWSSADSTTKPPARPAKRTAPRPGNNTAPPKADKAPDPILEKKPIKPKSEIYGIRFSKNPTCRLTKKLTNASRSYEFIRLEKLPGRDMLKVTFTKRKLSSPGDAARSYPLHRRTVGAMFSCADFINLYDMDDKFIELEFNKVLNHYTGNTY